MKTLITYINEKNLNEQNDPNEEAQQLISTTLRKFGSIRKGFDSASTDDVIKELENAGCFDIQRDEKNDEINCQVKVNNKTYEVNIYGKGHPVKGKIRIFNWQIMEQ